jgi:zinc transport system ATP-binding protein
MQKIIELKNICANYNGKTILEDVNLEVFENDFIGVIGPNGGGKTTLLRVILGLLKPYKGEMIIKNSENKSFFGYLPQYNNFDSGFPITLQEVVLSGLMSEKKLYKRYTSKDKQKANELIELTGLSEYKKSNIGEISGGQMQRALLCRAIISSPEVLILDEPVTYVDSNFENELYQILDDLNKRMAIIMVSHDLGMISSHVKTIACVNKRLHYHDSNMITTEQLNSYGCPIDLITHGRVPHRVLPKHE